MMAEIGTTWTTDPLFMKTGTDYYFYQNDHLGTPQKLTAINGAVVWAAKYTSFGEATVDAASTITSNLRFPGQYFDQETRLHYNYQRYYDPATGRYLNVDPIGLVGGINLYWYVANRPLNFTDPLGLILAGPLAEDPDFLSDLLSTRYGGYEIGAIYTYGITYVACCNEDNRRMEYMFEKNCFGVSAGASLSGGVVTGMNGSDCTRESYVGHFLEISFFAFIDLDIGMGKDKHGFPTFNSPDAAIVNDLGLTTPTQLKLFNVCEYKYVGEKDIGPCCNN